MKKLFAIALAAVMAISMTACGPKETEDTSLSDVQAKGKITVAISPDFAPSEFKDPNTGEVLGSDVFVAKYIAEQLGVELVIEEMDFSACQAAVQSGAIDFSVNGFAATDTRKENFICTTPYGFTTNDDSFQGLMVWGDQAENFKTAEDFAGKKIAVQNASLQYNLVTAQLPEDIEIVYVTTSFDGAALLATNKVDAFATTSETGALLAQNFSDLVMAPFHLDYTSTGTVALVNKSKVALGDAISAAIEAMNNDPEVIWTDVRREYTKIAQDLGVEVNPD